MAKILRDYKCENHGFFENWQPICPADGCEAEIKQVYLRAPGIVSSRTRGADKTLKGLAKDFNMTDIKSTREGEYQAGFYNRNNAKQPEAPREARPGDAAIWGGDNRFNMGNLLQGGVVRPVRDEAVGVRPQDVGNLTGPKAGSYIADHEGLTVNK